MAIRVCKGKYNISKDDKIDYTFLEVDDNNKFILKIIIHIENYIIKFLSYNLMCILIAFKIV